jgi:mono/diheme cytochrome c family protein
MKMKIFHRLIVPIVISLASGLAAAADMAKAKQNYDRYCAACHGFNGMSITPGVPNLRMNEGLMQADFQIVQKLKMGTPKKPPMLGILKDQELQDVVAYTRTIR